VPDAGPADPDAASARHPAVVSASGKVLPAQWANLSFRTSGRVVQVKVQAGDQVQSGQVLAQLDDVDAGWRSRRPTLHCRWHRRNWRSLKPAHGPKRSPAKASGAGSTGGALGCVGPAGAAPNGARAAELAAAEASLRQAEAEWKRRRTTISNLREGSLGVTEEHLRYACRRRAGRGSGAGAFGPVEAGPTEAELRAARAAVMQRRPIVTPRRRGWIKCWPGRRRNRSPSRKRTLRR